MDILTRKMQDATRFESRRGFSGAALECVKKENPGLWHNVWEAILFIFLIKQS